MPSTLQKDKPKTESQPEAADVGRCAHQRQYDEDGAPRARCRSAYDFESTVSGGHSRISVSPKHENYILLTLSREGNQINSQGLRLTRCARKLENCGRELPTVSFWHRELPYREIALIYGVPDRLRTSLYRYARSTHCNITMIPQRRVDPATPPTHRKTASGDRGVASSNMQSRHCVERHRAV